MLTDFYCEFKERKQVAAIYDSYPILVDQIRAVRLMIAEIGEDNLPIEGGSHLLTPAV